MNIFFIKASKDTHSQLAHHKYGLEPAHSFVFSSDNERKTLNIIGTGGPIYRIIC